MKKPNFFLVGPPKCGTTALYVFLKQHPDIFMSQRKELEFFVYGLGKYKSLKFMDPDQYSDYLSWFHDAQEEKIVGEGSTSYFSQPEVPIRIKKFNPESKIIAGLRQPKALLKSRYYFDSHGEPYPDFEKNFVMKGGKVNPQLLFLPFIQKYHSLFGDNFRVYLSEQLRSNPLGVVKNSYSFLGVDSSFFPETGTVHKTIPLSPRMHSLLTPFRVLPAWTGKIGFNKLCKKFVGPQMAYSIVNCHSKFIRYVSSKLSTKKMPDLDFDPGVLSILEDDHEKALNYCKEKDILL